MFEFRFRLQSASAIPPWGPPERPALSWFALTLGEFWIEADGAILFKYSQEMMDRCPSSWTDRADYQIAAFARELGRLAPHALQELPPQFERLVGDWPRLTREARSRPLERDNDLTNKAFQWLWARSMDTSWLTAAPCLYFFRIRDEITVGWDNREALIEGTPAWSEVFGRVQVSCRDFERTVARFQDDLIDQMAGRIAEIEKGDVRLLAPVSVPFLREQHERWHTEFAEDRALRVLDVDWAESAAALRTLGFTL